MNETSASERRSPSGLPLDPVYPAESPSELPGQFPFTRGIHESMYRGRLWTFRQYAGFGDAAETNERFRYLLAQGQTGLSVAFDLPTQIGYDSDDAIAAGEVGKVGVPISCADDMDRLFRDVPLDEVSVSMTINSTAAIMLAFFIVVAERRGLSREQLRGTLQNDMLKEFIARRTYRFPVEPSLKLTGDIFEFCANSMPRWNPISISGYHIREAGSTAVQEVAFTIANAIAYLDLSRARGIDLEKVTRRVSFFWNAHNHLLEEVAKFRAARRLWATIVRERFGIEDPRCAHMRFHTQTAGVTLTEREPENNIVRVTMQALAAVLGGTQSLHTNGMDEALGLPSEASARTALRTQQILANESGVADVADPLGGAPAIEALTDEIEARVRALIDEIDAFGGAVAASAAGFQQRLIEDEAYRDFKQVETGDRVVVGVNAYRDETLVRTSAGFQRVAPEIEDRRVEAIKRHKASREEDAVSERIERLDAAVESEANLIEPMIECARVGVTVGEMTQALARRYGEYRG